MLRDFSHLLTTDLVQVLSNFRFDEPNEIVRVAILRFEVISPDSFMWRLLINEEIYYLFAEDYVPNLRHVKRVYAAYIGKGKWEMVPAREAIPFSFSSPVSETVIYERPDDSKEMANFAVQSGHDFVFLASSMENGSDAYFSDKAPNGFKERN